MHVWASQKKVAELCHPGGRKAEVEIRSGLCLAGLGSVHIFMQFILRPFACAYQIAHTTSGKRSWSVWRDSADKNPRNAQHACVCEHPELLLTSWSADSTDETARQQMSTKRWSRHKSQWLQRKGDYRKMISKMHFEIYDVTQIAKPLRNALVSCNEILSAAAVRLMCWWSQHGENS